MKRVVEGRSRTQGWDGKRVIYECGAPASASARQDRPTQGWLVGGAAADMAGPGTGRCKGGLIAAGITSDRQIAKQSKPNQECAVGGQEGKVGVGVRVWKRCGRIAAAETWLACQQHPVTLSFARLLSSHAVGSASARARRKRRRLARASRTALCSRSHGSTSLASTVAAPFVSCNSPEPTPTHAV